MKKILPFCMLMLLGMTVYGQQTVTGKVRDVQTDEPVIGATVLIKGTSNGTVTDTDGNYSIQVKGENDVLVFSFIGYATLEETVGSRSVVNVSMEVDITQLSEVIVTAFGIEKDKKALGYAVTGVGSEDLSTVKQANVVNSLAGRVPGVVITQSTGGLGSGSRVVIRGNNSLTGQNQPLYVVDGVPVDNSGFGSANRNDPNSQTANTANYERVDYGTGISDLNPDDIESMSILKGPNAAALYGSRAANGVIMITTKKGRTAQGLGVSYSANFTWENPLLLPKYQNEYGQGSNGDTYTDLSELKNNGGSWGARMDGSNQLYWTGETKPYSAQPDNVGDFFETGFNAINTIALEGGSDKASMRFSYTNSSYNAIVPNSDLQKHNFNLRGSSQISDRLSVDSRVTYFHQSTQNRVSQGTEGLMAYLYTMPRNIAINDLKNFKGDGFAVNTWSNGNGNPYWTLNNDRNEDFRDRFSGFVKTTYKFSDNFSAFARIGSDQVAQKTERIEQPGHWFFQNGRFNYANYKTGETNADFLLMFNKDLSSKLDISVNAGGNWRLNTYEDQSVTGENFKIPTKSIVASATTTIPAYTPTQKKKVTSMYASAEFSYDDFLFLNLSARNDWSSALPSSNWSYFYPSASLSVLIDRFVNPSGNLFDYWKIRTSWAQVGNDTDPFQLSTPYILSGAADSYLGLPILSRSTILYDENLKPEQTSSFEIGTEFSTWGNRLYADISYYKIVSQDLIMRVPYPAPEYDQFNTNVGQMTNKGIELMLGGTVVKTPNLTWDISANFAKNKNTLDELIGDVENFTFSSTNAGTVTVLATVGGGYGDIYGYTYERDDAGNIVTDDQGIPQRNSDYTQLGNYQPDWTGGLSNTVSYKGLSLRVLIDARIGGEIYSGTDAAMDGAGVSEKTLQYRESGVVVDGVLATGEPNTTSITASQYWGNYSSIPENYIFDQTNIRLREASLNFNLPKSLIKGTPFQSVSVGLIGRNLFFLHKKIDNFDPESSYSTNNYAQGVLFYNLPTTRQYGFNLNIKF